MKALMMALILVASPVWAQSSDSWETTRKGGGRGEVSTYARKVDGSPVKAFKGEVELKASMTSVLAVITAVDTFPEWIFQNQSAERLTSDHKERILMAFNGIWPVSDRDVVLANTLSQDDASILVIQETADVEDIAQVLNALGVSARDIIAIFQALKRAGALQAELIIM